MDQNSLVDKLRKMSDRIIDDHKSVSLIILLGNNIEEQTTAFDYIISANWLNEYDQDEGMDIVLDYLYGDLSEQDISHISRVTIIHTSDPIVQNISLNINVSRGCMYLADCQFGNVVIPFAIMFEAKYGG